jgi:hypothetical protein
MIGRFVLELRATFRDYRECGDLGGHVRALWGVLTGRTLPTDRYSLTTPRGAAHG